MRSLRYLQRAEWSPHTATPDSYDLFDLASVVLGASGPSTSWLQCRLLNWKIRYTPPARYNSTGFNGSSYIPSTLGAGDVGLLVQYTSDGGISPSNRSFLLQGQQTRVFSPMDPFELSGPVWPTAGTGKNEIPFFSTQSASPSGASGFVLVNGFPVIQNSGSTYRKGTFLIESLVEFREVA